MPKPDWTQPIDAMIRAHGSRGGFVVAFPAYRPDQCLALAAALELPCFDFRQQVMSAHGWEADRLGFADLNATLAELAAKQGGLVNNVESLLSTKEVDAGARWLREFLATPWARPLIIPVAIYTQELPLDHDRVYGISDADLPAQSLLNRLAL
jgi:hypothetical protein